MSNNCSIKSQQELIMINDKTYHCPLETRYASQEMSYLFSDHFKYVTWRKLWVALAKAEKSLGLPIETSQITALEAAIEAIDYSRVSELEKKFRHDVMAHISAFAEAAPQAKGIIHLGATSAFVTDNTDLIQMRAGLKILKSKLVVLIRFLKSFAESHAALATLSYTHFQSAQPTTYGKRACLWLQDFLFDLEDLNTREMQLQFLGAKGATGTQASFLSLFEGDHEKVKKLETLVAAAFGFDQIIPISGQTYTCKQDIRILSLLSGLAASAHKYATDLRLLSHLQELEEPFGSEQVGSSAMPHKRNPMRSERICSISRYLISLSENPSYTLATQWLERSLDDSANRRLCIPEAFLSADALLNLLIDVTGGMKLYPKVIAKNLEKELPFLLLETILISAVKKGKDRQRVHEILRNHSLESLQKIKEEGASNDLLQRIEKDSSIGLSKSEIQLLLKEENYIGRSKEQVAEFISGYVDPLLKKFQHLEPEIQKITL